MKVKNYFSNFFTNKLVLYIVSFIALFNVIGYMVIGKYNIVIYFIVLAILVRYFSKNMIVVFAVPLLLVNLIALKGKSYMEGLENNNKENKEDKEETKKESMSTSEKVESVEPKKKSEHFEVGRPKNGKYKIDYASTIEDAYDQLNSILGKDGIKSLTDDTQRLLEQQTQLAGSLKDFGPMVEKMIPMAQSLQEMMTKMDSSSQNNIMNNVNNMLSGVQKMNKKE
jgi:hypothetical protein